MEIVNNECFCFRGKGEEKKKKKEKKEERLFNDSQESLTSVLQFIIVPLLIGFLQGIFTRVLDDVHNQD